jgi:hypothetical protein
VDDVALAAGDRERGPDRPAALADHGPDVDRADQGDAGGPAVEDLGAADQPVPARLARARDHAADDRQAGLLGVEALQEAVGREGERVGQQQHAGPLAGRQVGPAADADPVVQGQDPQRERLDGHARERGHPDGQARLLLQLAAAADHPLGGAADDGRGAGALRQAEGDAGGGVGVLHREEAHHQVGGPAELAEGGRDDLVEGAGVVGGGGDGGAEGEHGARLP